MIKLLENPISLRKLVLKQLIRRKVRLFRLFFNETATKIPQKTDLRKDRVLLFVLNQKTRQHSSITFNLTSRPIGSSSKPKWDHKTGMNEALNYIYPKKKFTYFPVE